MQKFRLFFTVVLTSLFLACGLHAHTITGTVISNHDDQPLTGVNVVIKNTNRGTVTGFDGRYSITIDSTHKVLVFSFGK
jgi:hypothetical protein